MKSFADETFYTPEQVAKKLQVSLTTIYNLIKSKEMPFIRVGKSFRIPESRLEQFIAHSRSEVPKVAASLIEQLSKSDLKEKIADVILFGSYARGDADENSDIDILLIYTILDEKEKELLVQIEDGVSSMHGYMDEMNVMKKSIMEWKELKDQDANLYKTVTKEGLSLWKK